MATITRNLVIVATTAAIAAPLAVKCYRRWIREKQAQDWLRDFGNHEVEIEDCLGEQAAAVVGAEAQIRGWRREPRGLKTKLSFIAADEAYLQFGRREKSQANDLVTRKFLRDWLRERQGPMYLPRSGRRSWVWREPGLTPRRPPPHAPATFRGALCAYLGMVANVAKPPTIPLCKYTGA